MAAPGPDQSAADSGAAFRAEQHPLLAPYFKMQRVGVPEQSIRTKVVTCGVALRRSTDSNTLSFSFIYPIRDDYDHLLCHLAFQKEMIISFD